MDELHKADERTLKVRLTVNAVIGEVEVGEMGEIDEGEIDELVWASFENSETAQTGYRAAVLT